MSNWSEAEDAQLTELWNKGLSANQIARQIGNGRTRCSVIGRKDRLGLPARDASKYGQMGATKRSPAARKAKVFAPVKIEDEPQAIGEFGDRGCKWPVGQPMDLLSCGQPRHGRHPYCEHHCSRAYQPAREKAQ